MTNIQRTISIVVPIILILVLFYFFGNLLSYLAIAWVISLIGAPLKKLIMRIPIGKFGINNTMSSILVLTLFVSLFFLIISFFAPQVITQANHLSEVNTEEWVSKLEQPLRSVGVWLKEKKFIEHADDLENLIVSEISGWFKPDRITQFLSSLVGFAGDFVLAFFSILFISFFLLKDDQLFLKALQSIVSDDKEDEITEILKNTSSLLSSYFGGIVTQMTVIVIIVFTGLSIIGIENALLIAFFAAGINVIPYLGPILGGAFALFMTITSNIDMPFYPVISGLLLKVIVVFIVMQLIDNFLLQPFIFSRSVRAHPLEIFFVILIGAQLGGIIGMIIAIPVYTVLRVVASVLLADRFQVVRKLTRSIQEDEK